MEKVAILLAVYNPKLRHILDFVNSINKQTVLPDTIYLIDDHSNSLDYLRIVKKKLKIKIQVHKNKINQGPFNTFITSIDKIKENIIFLADQDDIWHDRKIEEFLKRFNSDKNIGGVVCNFRLVDDDLKTISSNGFKFENRHLRFDFESLILKNNITGCCFAFRKKAFLKGKKNTEQFVQRKNNLLLSHDLWIALHVLAAKYKIDFINRAMVDYRQHDNNDLGSATFRNYSLLKLINPIYLLNYKESLGYRYRIIETYKLVANYLNYTPIKNQNLIIFKEEILNFFNHEIKYYCLLNFYGKIFSAIRERINYFKNKISYFPRLKSFLSLILYSHIKMEIFNREINDLERFISRLKLQERKQQVNQVNFFMPYLSSKSFFAGSKTILELALSFARVKKIREVNIILTDQENVGEARNFFYLYCKNQNSPIKKINFFSFTKNIFISRFSINIATAWWTSFKVEQINHRFPESKSVYFIQDNENEFYASSTRALWAKKTYLMKWNTAIISSKSLFFAMKPLMKNTKNFICLRPDLMFSMYKSLQEQRIKYLTNAEQDRGLNFFFYWRPSIPRNLSEYIKLLIENLQQNKFISSYDNIFFAGEDTRIKPFLDKNFHYLGKMNYSEYLNLIPKIDVCFSFINTAHSGVVHYDFSFIGTKTFCIKKAGMYLNKNMIGLSGAIQDDLFLISEELFKIKNLLNNKKIEQINKEVNLGDTSDFVAERIANEYFI